MLNNRLIKQLTSFGLTRQQAKLYLAGLSLGECLMAHLAKTAGVKRSSAYYAIDELQRRGFFSIKRKGKRIFYKAASPEQLIKMTEARLKEVMKLYPSFKRLTND